MESDCDDDFAPHAGDGDDLGEEEAEEAPATKKVR